MTLTDIIDATNDREALLGKIYTHQDGGKWYLLQIDGMFFGSYLCTFENTVGQKIRRINSNEFNAQ